MRDNRSSSKTWAVSLLMCIGLLLFWACDSGGSNGGTVDTTATLQDGDSFRSAKVTTDGNSSWFEVIDGSVVGTSVSATMVRASDNNSAEGMTVTLSYTEDEQNVLTFSNGSLDISATGRLSLDGDTYMVRGTSLTDGAEGELQLGVLSTSGADNTILSGDYLVATVHSDTSQSDGFFTGTYNMNFNSSLLTVTNLVSDATPATDYKTGSPTYTVSTSGELTVDAQAIDGTLSRDFVGAVRSDGELFVLADTRVDPGPATDNSVKTVFVGVKKAASATDAILAGTWDFGVISSGMAGPSTSFSWDENASTAVLDTAGNGTFTDFDGTSGPLNIDVSSDGTFLLTSFNSVGAVTPSGDVMFIVNTAEDGGEYEISIGIKQP